MPGISEISGILRISRIPGISRIYQESHDNLLIFVIPPCKGIGS
jgi:hypothetical protein